MGAVLLLITLAILGLLALAMRRSKKSGQEVRL
jgi:hypothetical protein